MAEPVARHGTYAGYTRHQRYGEHPCDACYAAKQAYDARWRSAPDKVRRNRLAARAQGRAYSRLVRMYPAVYAALYAEEKARLEAEEATP